MRSHNGTVSYEVIDTPECPTHGTAKLVAAACKLFLVEAGAHTGKTQITFAPRKLARTHRKTASAKWR
jgi:hypothetical protein